MEVKALDPLDANLTSDDIEEDVQNNLELFDYVSETSFRASLNKRYSAFEFDEDDYSIIWDNIMVKQMYLKALKERFTRWFFKIFIYKPKVSILAGCANCA